MENVLNEREVIRFLLEKGGRCTNFELVSNFRGVLNDPRYQGAARIKFKDIINTVAIVGEFQNTKYIELKREFYGNNHAFSQPESEPSSLSSESSSYSSPLSQNFQPYWRYRLSSSKQTLPSPPSLDFDVPSPRTLDPRASPSRNHPHGEPMRRCARSETLDPSHHGHQVAPPHQNRRFSTNSMASPEWEGSRISSHHRSANDLQRFQDQSSSRTSSRSDDVFQSYHPQRPDVFHCSPRSSRNESIRRTESFDPRSIHQEPSLCRSVEAMHGIPRPANNRSYSTPPSYQESISLRSDPDFQQDSDNLRNVAKALFRDSSARMSPRKHCDSFDPPRTPPRIDSRHSSPRKGLESDLPVPSWNPTVPKIMTPSNGNQNESSDSSKYSISSELRHSVPNSNNNRHSIIETKHSISGDSKDSNSGGPRDVTNFQQRRNSNQELPSPNLDASKNRYRSEGSLVSLRSEEESSGFVSGNNSGSCTPESGGSRDVLPPPLPERRRAVEHGKAEEKDASKAQQKEEEWTMSSAGKVRDRVQHFDDMEKRRNIKRSHSPLTPDKENRISLHSKGLIIEDNISISVIDSKLRKEWSVKAAQCDYHALVSLLKKEPKLAAVKDIAMGYTALHWAAKQGDANIIKLIAGSYKVNPNIRSNGGYTPVHLASLHKHDMIIHLLIHTYGADATIRDYSGKKAHQYPDHYLRMVAGQKTTDKKPPVTIIESPVEKEVSNSFMRIGSLNLRKSRKSTVFASVRGRNWGSNNELRRGYRASMRKKLHKSLQFQPSLEKRSENAPKNDSDSDSTFGFGSKKHS